MLMPAGADAKGKAQIWDGINPSGVTEVTYFKPAPRLTTLEGKIIVLPWNAKHNGDDLGPALAPSLD